MARPHSVRAESQVAKNCKGELHSQMRTHKPSPYPASVREAITRPGLEGVSWTAQLWMIIIRPGLERGLVVSTAVDDHHQA